VAELGVRRHVKIFRLNSLLLLLLLLRKRKLEGQRIRRRWPAATDSRYQDWCLLFVLIRHGEEGATSLRAGSERLGLETGEPTGTFGSHPLRTLSSHGDNTDPWRGPLAVLNGYKSNPNRASSCKKKAGSRLQRPCATPPAEARAAPRIARRRRFPISTLRTRHSDTGWRGS
jgi:hypothetical protein